MGRESIAMSPAELRGFLERTRRVVVATLGASGEPVGTLAACSLEGEQLVFALSDDGARRNLERDPRVCCSTDEYPTYYEIRGMTAHGRARAVAAPAALSRAEGACYALALDDVVSFDFAKIRDRV